VRVADTADRTIDHAEVPLAVQLRRRDLSDLGNATAVATEFSAELAITASASQDALLVVNGTSGNAFSLWQYVEATGAAGGAGEISASELSLIGVFSGNGAVETRKSRLA
jgi:hypothetical protein